MSSRGYWRQSLGRFAENRLAVSSFLVLILFIALALSAPLWPTFVTHRLPEDQDLTNLFAPPLAPNHWLGTDELGRDTLTRLVFGARVSLVVGFLTVTLALLIGALAGMAAGYFGGLVDDVVMRLVDILLSIPTIFLLIFMASLFPLPVGPPGRPWIVLTHDATSLSIVLAIVGWTPLARLVRAEVLALMRREFVVAARSVGVGGVRLAFTHLLPNVLPVMIVWASLGVGFMILAEAALDFIGLGIQPPIPSWGNMLRNAQTYFYQSAALVILPGAAIVVTVVVVNIVGNGVRDAFDPRLK